MQQYTNPAAYTELPITSLQTHDLTNWQKLTSMLYNL